MCFFQAFGCIDQNRDGVINKSDLKETYGQLGIKSICCRVSEHLHHTSGHTKHHISLSFQINIEFCVCAGKVNVSDEELESMLAEGKGPINFTVFLTLFGEKLNGMTAKLSRSFKALLNNKIYILKNGGFSIIL